MTKIQLGDWVRDVVTGFEGVASARHEYLTGCARISVQPLAEDGKLPDYQAFDEITLEVVPGKARRVPEGVHTTSGTPVQTRTLGGPNRYDP